MSFKGHVCWAEADAREILATEALEGKEAAFLATHLPITDFEVQGTHGSDIQERTEGALLEVLSAPERRHAFCVVEGEPGSGKSHLIRWLGVRWHREADLVLLIQRADGSLEGTLDQLTSKVPEHYAHLFAGLGSRREASLRGRARLFLSTLARTMEADYFEEQAPQAEWCAEHRLADLLDNPVVRDNWEAPERILNILSGRKSSELARFSLEDVAGLAELESRVGNEKPPPRAFRFMRRLSKEGKRLREFLTAGYAESDIERDAGDQLSLCFGLMRALNARLNHAVQNLLGISSHGLRELFLRLRRALRKDGRRLVLLLEDITNFQGIDRQLIDALVTQSATREQDDLCDLISAVGITPAYFKQYLQTMGNYVERITYHVRLGQEQAGSQYQDVASLRDQEAQVRFAANYLRATRAGLERLEEWGAEPGREVPNVCSGCPHRGPCHAAFGKVGGVGLYPFTSLAVTGMFARLTDPHGGATHQTPRGLIQGVLSPTLRHPEVIEDGEFPSPQVDVPWIPEERRRLRGDQKHFLAAQVPDPEVRERLERLLGLWGDRNHLETTTDASGELLFAGLSKGVYEAFSLPWLGDAERVVDAPSPPPAPAAAEPTPRAKPLVAPTRKPSRTEAIKSETRATGKAKKVRVTDKASEKRQQQLSAWRAGERLEEPQYWVRLVCEMLEFLPWAQMGVPPFVRGRFFTENLIKIEGMTGKREYHFEVPAAPWLQDGLESLLSLRSPTPFLDPEYQRRRLARALTALRRCVLARVDEILPKVDGRAWSVVGASAQFLVAAEWVRGGTSPVEPAVQQWGQIVGLDRSGPESPKERSPAWGRVLEGTKNRGKDRDMLRDFALLHEREGVVFLDAAEGYQAIGRLQHEMAFDAVPAGVPGSNQWSEMRSLAGKVEKVRGDLAAIPEAERRRIREWCSETDTRLRQRSLREHLERIDTVLKKVNEQVTNPSARSSEWSERKAGLEQLRLLEDGPSRALVDFVDGTLDGDNQDSSPAQEFGWALKAPVDELRVVLETLRTGDALIRDLFDLVQSYGQDDDTGGGVSLALVQEAGQRLKSVGDALRSCLEVKSEV